MRSLSSERDAQVLRDLPKKTERIEWCEMTALQKSIYNDALQRSRKTIFDLETGSAETSDAPATNGRGKPAKKKTRATARTKDKMYIENSSNVLMDLRKAASHPMLFRRRFTDETLSAIAKLLLKEPDFKKRGAVFQYVKEDMEVMTDAELQVFCETYKVGRATFGDDHMLTRTTTVATQVPPGPGLLYAGGKGQSSARPSRAVQGGRATDIDLLSGTLRNLFAGQEY